MKKLVVLFCVVAMLAATSALYAASNIYGVSGLIETPDDTIVAPKAISVNVDRIFNLSDDDVDLTTFGGAFGLSTGLEVGAIGIDSNQQGVDTQALVNAKYRILSESLARPAITLGVVDAADQLEDINGKISDPSAFIAISKNITTAAEGISGGLIKPLKGTVGFGSGLYKGGFASLDYSLMPKINVMVEYLSNGLKQETEFNAGLRFKPIESLAIDAGTIDFDGFYVGGSYVISIP